jgi:hypothetical protein
MDEPKPPGADSDDRGLFGKLPSTRPGVRSPRRDADKPRRDARVARPAKPAATRKDAGPPRGRPDRPDEARTTGGAPATPASAPPPTDPPRPPPQDEAARGEAPGVEDLAWAGITVAAEAATLGVKLLSRAVEAVRKPPDPR